MTLKKSQRRVDDDELADGLQSRQQGVKAAGAARPYHDDGIAHADTQEALDVDAAGEGFQTLTTHKHR